MQTLRLTKSDWAWTLVPFLFWYGSEFWIRPIVVRTTCGDTPELCTRDHLPWLDRLSPESGNGPADHSSTLIQNGIIVMTLLALSYWNWRRKAFFVRSVFTDVVLYLQAAALNGFINATVRNWVQRPRPLVYLSPSLHGGSTGNYNSFYSGHTSAVALSFALLATVLWVRGASRQTMITVSAVGAAMTFVVGLLRVLGGRHFITDVLAGAVVGALIGYWVVRRHQCVEGGPASSCLPSSPGSADNV